MREVHHARRAAHVAIAAFVTASGLIASSPVSAEDPRSLDQLPACRQFARPEPPRPDARPPRWRALLDGRGWLAGYQLRVDRDTHSYGTGPSAFLEGPFEGFYVAGERSGSSTRLHYLDRRRACVLRRLTIATLVFGLQLDPRDGTTWVSAVQPGSRRELGIWRLAPRDRGRFRLVAPVPDGFASLPGPRSVRFAWDAIRGLRTRWCAALHCALAPTTGATVSSATQAPDANVDASQPLVEHRQTPSSGGWPGQTVLQYRWHASDTPPGWMRIALRDATDDAADTTRSRAPVFVFNPDADDAFRYVTSFPSDGCAQAIACATRNVPSSWTIRMRPQGYEFRWGRLRWCQADPGDGCFDVERVALHELGHVGAGLEHPEDHGFRMRPLDTVMHAVVPARDQAGSGMRSYGSCDVATFQERYGLPTMSTKISKCQEIDTRLSLSASTARIRAGDPVTFRAFLRTIDWAGLGQVAGIPLNAREVQLRRRLAGTSGAWVEYWMKQEDEPGVYLVTLRPSGTYEYQAVFRRPDDEGLNGDFSNIVTVRVDEGCVVSPCSSGEDR